MKIDFIEDVEHGDFTGIFLRIMSFTKGDLIKFIGLLNDLVEGKCTCFITNEVDFIDSINCEIEFKISSSNKGLHRISESVFLCELNSDGYIDMINYLNPFLDDLSGFQFLVNPVENVELLISHGGGW